MRFLARSTLQVLEMLEHCMTQRVSVHIAKQMLYSVVDDRSGVAYQGNTTASYEMNRAGLSVFPGGRYHRES